MVWEYKLIFLRNAVDPDSMLAGLSELGNDGWEAVSMTQAIPGAMFLVLLKRPKKSTTAQTS